ncbi:MULTISPECIES: type II toxin-antitoxin system RelB/DinJ family antitoxin [Gordonibacter]|uniref:type II toxin-antitoxin system RelB/DinJ family antitoxin n=1 Tax=Gordonibacter TaxID=644652 RepID=UPI00262D3C6B|nr:type II toxin-antitoxin system RelB/DinJ family antitoxin [Gordonibacter sp. RACS_AR49]MDN4509482.1 type II toxin-antitoxin system RelB/DinJ family antitoxin [Gordonibacter sp. RACS_AR49]
MDDSMVTARMAAEKKRRGASILSEEGLSASQAINLMYDKLIEEGGAAFLCDGEARRDDGERWAAAACFVDSLSSKCSSRFDDMSKAEVRQERLRSRGLM